MSATSEIAAPAITFEEWRSALRHVNERLQIYRFRVDAGDDAPGFLVKHVVLPLLARFDGGERTRDLYEALRAIA